MQKRSQPVEKEKAEIWLKGMISNERIHWLKFIQCLSFLEKYQKKPAEDLGLSYNEQRQMTNMLLDWMIATGALIPRDQLPEDKTAHRVYVSFPDNTDKPWLIYDKQELMICSKVDARAIAETNKEILETENVYIEAVTVVKHIGTDPLESRFFGDDYINRRAEEVFIGGLNRFMRKKKVAISPDGRNIEYDNVVTRITELLKSYGIHKQYNRTSLLVKYPADILQNPISLLDHILFGDKNDMSLFFQAVPKEVAGKMKKLFRAKGKHVLLRRKERLAIEKTMVDIFLIARAIENILSEEGVTKNTLLPREPRNLHDVYRSTIVMLCYRIEYHNAATGKAVAYSLQNQDNAMMVLPIRC